jgi:hypothetical protein
VDRPTAISLAVALCAAGCGDNETFLEAGQPYTAEAPEPLPCLPNLDGRIDSAELTPFVGVPVRYRVTLPGTAPAVDLAGLVTASGARAWDWTAAPAAEGHIEIQAEAIDAWWFAAEMPGATFVAPTDAAGRIRGAYHHDAEGIWLHGQASAEPDPPEGRTLLVYDAPVSLYRFPLQPGAKWVATGTVKNATFQGLPYAGKDVYEVEVGASGELLLPDVIFATVLRVDTKVTLQPAVGASVVQRQSTFLFECLGEVARATSLPGEAEPNFTTAAEVRRLGL